MKVCNGNVRVSSFAKRCTLIGTKPRRPTTSHATFDWFSGFKREMPTSEISPIEPHTILLEDTPAILDHHLTTETSQPELAHLGNLIMQIPPNVPRPKRDYLEARQMSIYQLLDSEDMKFDIPVYQRPYSWQTKQMFEMLQDFYKAYMAKQEYFLGAIVTTRASEDPRAAFQVIDGQQRLTSLFMMLGCLHDWAGSQDNEGLQQRVWRMLHLQADPLDDSSKSRYRLQLREGDDAFFQQNVLKDFLPKDFYFSGVAAQSDNPTEKTESIESKELTGAEALDQESHWRLYSNASFLRTHLRKLVESQGLNLQDFMFHVLRNCYLVVMTARDEDASFRIFSTLNSRGMDLSEVDKLKADLLQVLEPSQRILYSAQWAEMENLLGRQQFHNVFSYMKGLASVLDPAVNNCSVLEYFTRQQENAHTVSQIIQVGLDYSRILLQLRQCRWGNPESTGNATDEVAQVLAALNEQCRHINMLEEDNDRLAVTLEFFLQVEDPELRLRFLRSAEALSLLLGLMGDAALKAEQWREAAKALLSRPLDPLAVLETIVLSPEDKALFLSRLDSKDLSVTVDQRTLIHLLLRAEGAASEWQQEQIVEDVEEGVEEEDSLRSDQQLDGLDDKSDSGSSQQEAVVFEVAVAGSIKALTPSPDAGNGQDGGIQTSLQGTEQAHHGSSLESNRFPSKGREIRSYFPAQLCVERIMPQHAPEGSRWRKTKVYDEAEGTESKYWYEVQRLFWQGKLGNLVLLPFEEAGGSAVASADYDVKAAYYKECGGESMFPNFTGAVSSPTGRYGRHKFSFEDCQSRHADLVDMIAQTFQLYDD
ncbi:hypothetical protein CEUSTIGMA_g472.t1 [Chlamydomonas eustigma]|uniref:GmrSD restriction endonucleases N-terminal domain-containing protein n=1 Tax=Chlamydomonas eustigma TaxID=1157962 RepID=A0A250WR45_9CHLO|nr:hypothetical protein CEUSTIGMA_g472.t1 [Chlamydomonas eustigma]|eukprot:GAX73020.1 hypothetical protein CEUSTIGMA_g472.t1 [Chlamydomonas eustigma]